MSVDRDEVLKEFKRVLSEQQPTAKCHLPDDILLRVLTSRSFNLEKAITLLDKYVNAKKNHPELFESPNNHDESILKRVGTVLPDSVRTIDGRRCAFTLGVNWDPDVYTLDKMVPALVHFLESNDLDKDFRTDGYVHIVDAADLSWKHVKAIRPSIVISAASLITHELPINLKQIIVFNANLIVDVIWKICKPLLPSDLVKLITIIGAKHPEKLEKFLPKDVLEQNSFVPNEETINSHAKCLIENRGKLISLWNVVFNEETV